MGKKESYERELEPLIQRYFHEGKERRVVEYLTAKSNLPGPRANLELLGAFGEAVSQHCRAKASPCWELAMKLAERSRVEAGGIEEAEFLVMCGVVGLASIGAALPQYFSRALTQMKEYSHSYGWRTRESVAMGIQRLIKSDPAETLRGLKSWVEDDDWLAMRAVAAGVAEPALVKDHVVAEGALDLHKKILSRLASAEERKGENLRVLRQALGYSLSVVAKELPKEGFGYLRELAEGNDPDLRWIVKENLKKDRLVKNFPDETKLVANLVQ